MSSNQEEVEETTTTYLDIFLASIKQFEESHEYQAYLSENLPKSFNLYEDLRLLIELASNTIINNEVFEQIENLKILKRNAEQLKQRYREFLKIITQDDLVVIVDFLGKNALSIKSKIIQDPETQRIKDIVIESNSIKQAPVAKKKITLKIIDKEVEDGKSSKCQNSKAVNDTDNSDEFVTPYQQEKLDIQQPKTSPFQEFKTAQEFSYKNSKRNQSKQKSNQNEFPASQFQESIFIQQSETNEQKKKVQKELRQQQELDNDKEIENQIEKQKGQEQSINNKNLEVKNKNSNEVIHTSKKNSLSDERDNQINKSEELIMIQQIERNNESVRKIKIIKNQRKQQKSIQSLCESKDSPETIEENIKSKERENQKNQQTEKQNSQLAKEEKITVKVMKANLKNYEKQSFDEISIIKKVKPNEKEKKDGAELDYCIKLLSEWTHIGKNKLLESLDSCSGDVNVLVDVLRYGMEELMWIQEEDKILRLICENKIDSLKNLQSLIRYKGTEAVKRRAEWLELNLNV